MADQSLNKNIFPPSPDFDGHQTKREDFSLQRIPLPYNFEDHSWVLFFSLSSWLTITIIFLTGIYKNILFTADQKYPLKKGEDMIRTVIIDQKNVNRQVEPDREYFLSDKNNMGSGMITEKKGFEALSKSRELRFGNDGETDREFEDTREKTDAGKVLSNQFFSKILDSKSLENGKTGKIIKKFSRSSIPDNYKLNKEFIFSWDRNGQPVIPTMFYKHFAYFKNMLDKIQANWSPPGGSPYPIYDNTFNTEGYVPGRSTYQTFPEQDILIVFSLNSTGDIQEVKLIKSLGFESLDRSCKDAIERSRNFGPTPDELLENDVFIMPLTFRIITSR